nr:integrase arm-type DNA-binding domain-containing protein [Burkholderia perseverans]
MQPGTHVTIDGCPGLRLEASTTRRSWIYRYKSPVDGRMRQTKIGEWPALSLAAAASERERLRTDREAGRPGSREAATGRFQGCQYGTAGPAADRA